MSYEEDYRPGKLAAYETVVIGSRMWLGTEVTFSDDGREWVEAWMPANDRPHPVFARARVTRSVMDREVVTTVVARWDEYAPLESPEHLRRWYTAPTTMLGACAAIAAYRRGFRDLVASIDEQTRAEQPASQCESAESPAATDWASEAQAMSTIDELDALWMRARKQRAVTIDLESVFKARRRELAAEQPADLTQETSNVPRNDAEIVATSESSGYADRPTPAVLAKRARKRGGRRG